MKRTSDSSVEIAKHIYEWLNSYVPLHVSNSKHTLKSYQISMSLYLSFLEKEKKVDGRSFCADCFRFEYIEEWLGWLVTQRKCGDATRNNRLASIRAFLKYLAKKDPKFLYLQQLALQVRRKRVIKKKVRGLSRDAVKAIMNQPDQRNRTDRRDLTLLVLMYNTAARIDEVLSLKVNDINLSTNKPHITILGKGEKVRTLYLLPKTAEHLKQYISEFHGAQAYSDSHLFYSRNTGTHGKMSQAAVSKRLKSYAAVAHKHCVDVPLNLHAHQIRHARASHWLEDGMNIVQISFLLGHEQLETTMIYLDVSPEQEAVALASLQDASDKAVLKKWKDSNDLASLCGLSSIKA
jgi:site-specific recombinase XerD